MKRTVKAQASHFKEMARMPSYSVSTAKWLAGWFMIVFNNTSVIHRRPGVPSSVKKSAYMGQALL